MTDAADVMRRTAAYYDESLPPELLVLDPSIASLTPSTVSAAAGPITVTVRGSSFVAGSVVEIQQAARPTTFVDSTTLTVSYDPSVAGTVQFTVRSGEHESNSFPFVVGALAADDDGRQLEQLEQDDEQTPPKRGTKGHK